MGTEIDWNDKQTEKEMSSGNVERYSAEEDRLDLVRILTVPVKYFVHVINRKYYNCGKADGKNGKCLLCERGIDRVVKVGVVMVHIASKEGNGAWKMVGTCKVWLFGRDKMKSIKKLLGKHSVGKEEEWLKKQDLFIDCVDKQFQELGIEWTHKDSKINKGNVGKYCGNFKKAKEQLDWFSRPSDKKRQMEALGMEADGDDDPDAIDDINSDPVDDPIGDIDDSMAANSEQKAESSGDVIDDMLNDMDSDPFASDGAVPF